MKKNQTLSFLVFPAYAAGMIIGLYLIVIAAWADMESAFYGFSRLANAGLRGFSCPVLMTREETGMVSLRVSNTTDDLIRPAVRIEISTTLMTQEFSENLEIPPGESKWLEWSVGPENIDLKRFIFAKALLFSAYPTPNREATCGIFIIDLPGSGRVILTILVALGLLGMGWGLYGLNKSPSEWMGKHIRGMAFLAAMIVLGLPVSFLVGWLPAILILAVAVLMIIILSGSWLMSENRKR